MISFNLLCYVLLIVIVIVCITHERRIPAGAWYDYIVGDNGRPILHYNHINGGYILRMLKRVVIFMQEYP